MLKRIAVVAIALVAAAPAVAADVIVCKSPDYSDVLITINDSKRLGRMVSCIKGDFIADMTPCAPNGGYGLSYPTGNANLAKIVDRWQDYGGHLGGITGFSINRDAIKFDGGFFSSGNWSDRWRFSVNRLTGEAALQLNDDKELKFTCSKASQKF